MAPIDIVVFGVTLFLALAALINWRHRRVVNARRLNRGLRSYVSGKPLERPAHEDRGNLMVA